MKAHTVALAGAMSLLCGVAIAQTAPMTDLPQPAPQQAPVAASPQPVPQQPHMAAPPPPPPGQQPMPGPGAGPGNGPNGGRIFGGPGAPGGPGGDRMGQFGQMHGRMGGPQLGQPMSRGAALKVDRDGGYFLKCADEDTTKSCLEAAAPLLEKLGARGAGQR